MGQFIAGTNFVEKSGKIALSPSLLQSLQAAAAASPYNVVAFSGVQGRSSGTVNHPAGHAVDVYLQDPQTGKYLANYNHPMTGFSPSQIVGTWQSNYPAYEQFAQTVKLAMDRIDPATSRNLRWGGYFNAGKGNSVPDLMHFDVTPQYRGVMSAGNTWAKGATSDFASRWGIQSNGGLSGNPRMVSALQQFLSGGPTPPADIPSGTAPPIPLDRPAFRSPAAPGGNAGDSLAFSPVNVGMAEQLPLVFDSGSDYGRMPQFANASGSPTDRDEASAARLNAALAWLSGGRNEPAAAAAPKDGLSTALDWLSGGRDSGQPYGSSALTQAQRNAMLTVPETPPPLPIADPRLTPVTPMDRPATAIAATAPASSTPAPQLVNVNGHTYEVGSILQAAGRAYQVNADGTFTKMPSISLGTNTIASGMAGQALNDAIKTAQTEAPAILSSAAGKIGSIFGNLFGGNNGAPVPPLDVPRTITAPPSTFPDRPTVVAPNTRPAAPVSTFPDRPTVIAPNTTPALPFAGGDPLHPPAPLPVATAIERALNDKPYGGYIPGGIPTINEFGTTPPPANHAAPASDWASPYYSAALADSPASSKGYGGYIPGGMPSGDDTQKSLRPASADPLDLGVTQTVTQMVPVTKTTYQTKQSLNPAYSAWLKDQNSAIYGVPDVESPSLDANGNVVLPDSYLGAAPKAKPAPPKYITTRVPVTTRALVQRQVQVPTRPVAPAAPASTPAIAAALTAARMPVVAQRVLSAPQAANYLSNPQLQAEYPNPVMAAVTGAANTPVGSIAAPSTGGVISPFHSF